MVLPMQQYSGELTFNAPSGIGLLKLTLNWKSVGKGWENTWHSGLWLGLSTQSGPQRGKEHFSHKNWPSTGSKHSKQAGPVSWFGPNTAGSSLIIISKGLRSLVATRYRPTCENIYL